MSALLPNLFLHLFLIFTVLSLPLAPFIHQHKLLLRQISSEENYEAGLVTRLDYLEGLLEEQDNLSKRSSILKLRTKRNAVLSCPDLNILIGEYNKVIHIVREILKAIIEIQSHKETSNHESLLSFLRSMLSNFEELLNYLLDSRYELDDYSVKIGCPSQADNSSTTVSSISISTGYKSTTTRTMDLSSFQTTSLERGSTPTVCLFS